MTNKEIFYEELAAHFTKEEQDCIKAKCTSMEKDRPANYDSEKFYKWISSIVKNQRFGYHKCMLMLENAHKTLTYSSYIDNQKADAFRTMEKQIMENILPIIKKHLTNLNEDKQLVLASSIAINIKDSVYHSGIIGTIKPLYEDLLNLQELSIYNQNSNNKLDKITFTKHEGGSLVFRSEMFTQIMQKEFYHYIMRSFHESSFKSENDIKTKIDRINTAEKYMEILVIKIIAEQLINNGILSKTSNKNNSLGLLNKNGEPLEFPNSIGVLIFDIVRKLKLINNNDADIYTGIEKKDYIKSKLKTSNNSRYQFDIDSLLEGFDDFFLWLFKKEQ